MIVGFNDEPPEFQRRLPPGETQNLPCAAESKPPLLTALQLMRVGWMLHIDVDGCRLVSPKWEFIEPEDILFIDDDGREVADDENGRLVFGATLYRILAE